MRRIVSLVLSLCIILSAFTLLASVNFVSAETEKLTKVDGDTLKYSVNGDYVTITGCKELDATLTIPGKIEDKEVKAIAADAFKDRTDLSSVVFNITLNTPEYVETPEPDDDEDDYFPGYWNTPVSNSYVETIGASAFAGCTALKAIEIPISVKTIGAGAFANSGLKSITYNSSITDWAKISKTESDFAEIDIIFGMKAVNDTKAAAPTVNVEGKTATITPVAGYEYKIEGGDWTTNNVFTGLNHATNYTFYQRIAETDVYLAGPASDGTKVLVDDHVFDQEKAEEAYFVSGATCTEKAVYKKSCACGEAGTETFKFGETLAHTFDKEVAEDKYLVSGASCTAKAVYKKSCACGEAGTETFEFGEKLPHNWGDDSQCDDCEAFKCEGNNHTFDQEVVADKYLVSGATCTAKAVYKKSCTCGEAGTETFEYGETLAHTFDKEIAEDKYLVSGATCTAKAVYKKSCACGEAGTETFEFGETLAHTFDKEVVADKYLVSGATCTAKAVYKKSCACGEAGTETFEFGEKLAHTYNAGVVTKAATCKATGVRTYTCTAKGCGATKTATIAKTTAHKYVNVLTRATLSKNGSIVKKCSVCGVAGGTTYIYAAKTVKLSATSYTYNGKAKTPTVTVKDSKGKTISKSYYTVKYASGRKNVGKYKVTVTFKGNYSGTKTLYFTITPVKTSITKLAAAKKALTVSISKKSSQVTGYEIQYATSKKFTKAKTATIKSYKTTKTTLKKLSAKKTYYVRVRTYKTVGKTKYYSGWSTVKYKKTK